MTFNRQKIIAYIESCHLPDGGYFFAKVEPSSGLETYLAVKTLQLLGLKTKNAKSIASFWKQKEAGECFDSLFLIFLAVETHKELGQRLDRFKKYSEYLKNYFNHFISRSASFYSENKKQSQKGFSAAMSYFGTIGKELQDLFYLTVLGRDLKIKTINKNKTFKLIVSLQNKNGGFGRGRESHLMTTYHALSILKVLSLNFPNQEKIHNYLRKKWENCHFLEDLFCIVEILALLGKPLPDVSKVIQFVNSCQRSNSGFGRAPVMSIPTIEDTYHAVSVIKTCENYSRKKFLILKCA